MIGQHAGHPAQDMRGKVFNANPGQEEEPVVICDQMQVLPSHGGRPADEAVPTTDMPGSRGPGQTGNGPGTCKDDVLEMLTHRLAISQIVMLLHEAVEHGVRAAAADLPEFQWPDTLEIGDQGCLIGTDQRWSVGIDQRVDHVGASGRQADVPRTVKCEHEASANHVA